MMLTWKPGLELGVRVLDTHHQRMFALTNEVISASGAPVPRATVLAKLHNLAEFTAWHFAFEEDLMVETGFDGDANHGEQHGELLGQLRRFIARVDRGSVSPVHNASTFHFLGKWVTQHILLTDRLLAAHLLKCGWDPVRDNPI